MKPMPVSVLLVPLVAALVSCSGQGASSDPPGPIRFDVGQAEGLDVVQVGGGADVDYIIDSLGCGAAWLDYDGDGDADLYLAQGATKDKRGPPDRLLRNDGDADGDGVPEFSDVTEAVGLGDTSWSFGVAVADYDNDGDPDIYLTNWGANRLYRNNGNGTFTDIAAVAGVAHDGWGVSAVWGDPDRDGDLDLYVTNYIEFEFEQVPARGEGDRSTPQSPLWKNLKVFHGPRGLPPGGDVYFRNEGDPDGDGIPRFADATVEVGLSPRESSYGLAALFFDADGDGDSDLYVANDSLANLFFVNRGDGTFEERGIISGLAYSEQGYEQAGMGVAGGDFDRDGLVDLAVTNFSHDHDTLYHNDAGGFFTDVSHRAGLGGTTHFTLAWGIAFADLDHDGWEDLFVAHGHVYPQVDQQGLGTTFRQVNGLLHNLGNSTFDDVASNAGPGLRVLRSSRALLPLDLDRDGDLDFLVTNLNEAPDLLLNTGAPGRWLQVRLVGRQSNRDGIGARIAIHAGGRRQVREVTRTASYASSTLPLAHFGLADSVRVDRLEVFWPSGRTSVMERIESDRQITIEEPPDG